MLVLSSPIFLGVSAVTAQEVSYDKNASTLTLPKDKNTAYAIFRRLDDIWIVSSSTQVPLTFNGNITGPLLEKENLYVRQGQGVRLGFERLESINITQNDDSLKVRLNTPASITPLDVSIITNGATSIKAPLGTGDMRRATSFDTGESYLVLPTFLNRGLPQIREKGDIRQLKTNMGGTFVSSEGLPIGFDQDENIITFKVMNDPLSRAAAARKSKQTAQFVDRILAELAQTKQDISQQQESISRGERAQYPVVATPRRGQRSTYASAMAQMNAALARVDAIGTEKARRAARLPEIETQKRVSELEKKINLTEEAPETAQDEKISTTEQVLAASTLLPDFGRRSLSEYRRIAARLKDDWVFARNPDDKTGAAHQLAAFYIQRGLYPEALGVLRTLKQRLENQENADEDLNKTRILEAVASLLMERFDFAADMLEKVPASPDRDLWLGVAMQGQGKSKEAADIIDENIDTATSYPPVLNQAVRYYFARALFENGRITDSMNQLDRLALLGGENRFLPKAQLLMGRLYEAENKLDNAEQIYINLASHPNREVASFALMHFMNLLTSRGDLTPEAAIVRYENLRFLWRGDKVEEESLYRLGQLYIQTGRYHEALERLRSLTANFPESGYAEKAAAQMTKVYEDVIMGRAKGPDTDKLDILALYYDFRELTPSGEEGDKLVTHVADELAALGLYERAEDILKRQLQFRVRDRKAVGRLGFKLAEVHAKNFKPQAGLKVLDNTNSSSLPASLKAKRKLLRAELLALDQRPEAALSTALEVNTPAAKARQAALAWELGRDKVIIDALSERFNGAGGTEWTLQDATQFLQLATALSRTGQRERLSELRLNYQPGIKANDLSGQVLFLVQAADESSPLPQGAALAENPTAFWPKATRAIAQQNSFNNSYKDLRQRWQEERESVTRTEMRVRNQELRQRR